MSFSEQIKANKPTIETPKNIFLDENILQELAQLIKNDILACAKNWTENTPFSYKSFIRYNEYRGYEPKGVFVTEEQQGYYGLLKNKKVTRTYCMRPEVILFAKKLTKMLAADNIKVDGFFNISCFERDFAPSSDIGKYFTLMSSKSWCESRANNPFRGMKLTKPISIESFYDTYPIDRIAKNVYSQESIKVVEKFDWQQVVSHPNTPPDCLRVTYRE